MNTNNMFWETDPKKVLINQVLKGSQMNINKVKKLFIDKFYNPTYVDWKVDKVKAGKDIVGARYENFRETYYKDMGFEIADGRKI